MTDWAESLGRALHSGDPAYMRAMFAQVPAEVREAALAQITQAARASLAQGDAARSLGLLDQLVELAPGQAEWQALRANTLLALKRHADARDAAQQLVDGQPEVAVTHVLLARAHEGLADLPAALAAYRRARSLGAEGLDARIGELENDLERRGIIDRMIRPEAEAPAADPQNAQVPDAPPLQTFDPAVLRDHGLPESLPAPMVEGLRQHLQRYGGQQAAKSALARLDDSAWTQAWDVALATLAGTRVRFHGSELGVFAMRALAHGATAVEVAEAQPQQAHIAAGVIRKNLLADWHAAHGGELEGHSEDERRASFEAYARPMRLLDSDGAAAGELPPDRLVVPAIDHSLLGTGIVAAIERHRPELAADAQVLPAGARLFAQGIQWKYPGAPFDVEALGEFRWSHGPEAFEWPDDAWCALTEPAEVAAIDFSRPFEDVACELRWRATSAGRLDGILLWFELDLGAVRYSNAPGEAGPIPPAFQHVDALPIEAGDELVLDFAVTRTRVLFQTRPPIARMRQALLPSWYLPMVLDAPRNRAYGDALAQTLAARGSATTLDIGAGCGLLSMLAARAGAERVVGCEISPSMHRVGVDVVARNGFAGRVQLVNRDCRQLRVPDDLPERADLVVFEMFDCSLIGEGVLHYLAHAREHLATPDARYLPRAGGIRAMLVEYRADRILDVDVNLLNPYRYSTAFINVDADRLGLRALSAPFAVFDFDFASATPTPQQAEAVVEATAAGIAGAVLFWFELDFGDNVRLATAPGLAQPPHWKQGLQFLPELRVEPAMPLPVQMRHDGSSLAFRWKDAELPPENFSRLPRFDMRWLQQAGELDAQTQRLLQHCLSDPAEYARVAELASRFAVDPARYGLDPRIAQRFAASFFAR